MKYDGFTTFKTVQSEGILTVTFDFRSVNVQGQEMLADLNSLAMRLERDRQTKVVISRQGDDIGRSVARTATLLMSKTTPTHRG